MKKLSEVIKTKLRDHQKEGVKYIGEHHYSICGDDMGLGKSLEAIAPIMMTDLPTLIICPAFLRLKWAQEFKKHCIEAPQIKIIKGRTNVDTSIPKGTKVIITGYDSLFALQDIFKWAKFWVVDEIHQIKNLNSQRFSHLYRAMQFNPPERFLGLSGTLAPNNIPELYAPLKLVNMNPKKTSGLDLDYFIPNFTFFCRHFSEEIIKGRYSSKYSGLKNKDLLIKLMKGKYFRRNTKSVQDLPEVIFKEVLVDYDSEIDLELKTAWDDFNKSKIDGHLSQIKSQAAFLTSKFTGNYVNNLLNQGLGPVVVFTDHIAPIHNISRTIQNNRTDGKKRNVKHKYHRDVGIIQGSVNTERRQDIVDRFQQGRLDCIVATIGSANTGFDLTRASHLVFNDFSWNPAENAQAWKRIHRIGQEKSCVIHKILGSKMSEVIMNVVFNKQETLKHIEGDFL